MRGAAAGTECTSALIILPPITALTTCLVRLTDTVRPVCVSRSTELLIRKLPFQRLVREIAQDFKTGMPPSRPPPASASGGAT